MLPSPLAIIDIAALKSYAASELSKSNWFKRLFVSKELLKVLDRFDKEKPTAQQIEDVYSAFFGSTGFLNWLGKKFLPGLTAFANATTTKAEEEKRSKGQSAPTAPVSNDVAKVPTPAQPPVAAQTKAPVKPAQPPVTAQTKTPAPAQPPVAAQTKAPAPAQPPVAAQTKTPAPAQPPVAAQTKTPAPAQPPVAAQTKAPVEPAQPPVAAQTKAPVEPAQPPVAAQTKTPAPAQPPVTVQTKTPAPAQPPVTAQTKAPVEPAQPPVTAQTKTPAPAQPPVTAQTKAPVEPAQPPVAAQTKAPIEPVQPPVAAQTKTPAPAPITAASAVPVIATPVNHAGEKADPLEIELSSNDSFNDSSIAPSSSRNSDDDNHQQRSDNVSPVEIARGDIPAPTPYTSVHTTKPVDRADVTTAQQGPVRKWVNHAAEAGFEFIQNVRSRFQGVKKSPQPQSAPSILPATSPIVDAVQTTAPSITESSRTADTNSSSKMLQGMRVTRSHRNRKGHTAQQPNDSLDALIRNLQSRTKSGDTTNPPARPLVEPMNSPHQLRLFIEQELEQGERILRELEQQHCTV